MLMIMLRAFFLCIAVLFFKEFFLMKVQGILSLVMAVLFSLGLSVTAFAADAADVLKNVTEAASAVVDDAADSAVTTAKEKAGEAMANLMGEDEDESAVEEGDAEGADDENAEEADDTSEDDEQAGEETEEADN
jgi:hypothetical protein